MGKESKAKDIIKASTGDIADLIGNSVTIQLPGDEGGNVIVPVDKTGNKIANMIVAAEIRHIIQKSIKTYREKEMLPTPKDLKDLAEAAKSLAQFSGEIYKDDDAPLAEKTEKKAEKAGEKAPDVNFDDAIEVNTSAK